jgi:Capsule assembly protein Wzi
VKRPVTPGLLLALCFAAPIASAHAAPPPFSPNLSSGSLEGDGPSGQTGPSAMFTIASCMSGTSLGNPTPASSTYVPMDSWIYVAMDRLHALGYVDSAFLDLRPWTRLSILHMLQETSDKIETNPDNQLARALFTAVCEEVAPDERQLGAQSAFSSRVDTVYNTFRGINGTPLRDSYHLGETIINDYGRPYQEGLNNYSGFSARAEYRRLSLYFRGEYQHAPGAAGYSQSLSELLSNLDEIPYPSNPIQDTIPQGPIANANLFRVMEANLSFHLAGHEISFGKNDHWLGPAKGASMSWSTNAENIYAFEINRVEPLRIPGLSQVFGPFRYDFYVGSLKGHTYPNDPWVHAEKISFKPTRNLELGFERTVIWGGKGHVPITIHSFLRSFLSFQNVSIPEKYSRSDPGARFGSFDFNYRLPFVRNWLTLYADSEAHDDVNPISAPRRAAVLPGIYLSHFPVLHNLDLRVEGESTDPVSDESANGNFLYWETIQRQGTTNKGFLFTDWIGRDSKGGQAWLTYHLSPMEYVQFSYRNAKADKNFIPFGTTQNLFQISAVKRIKKDVEISGWLQQEEWKAPIYKPGLQSDTLAAAQITWYPKLVRTF